MIGLSKQQFLIDGTPVMIFAGEIHYFRLAKEEWQDRITKLKQAGMNAVASYIPWICHEEKEGEFDLDGHSRAELDIIGFIELCRQNDLYFIARPGPFVMAEMKNEGIPYWVMEKYPDLIPHGWEDVKAATKTLDYLAPDFLKLVNRWYAQIIPILSGFSHDKGGNLIACQLDNEIGMLSWVSNTPDLTAVVRADFVEWLKKQYTDEELAERYPVDWSRGNKEILQQPQESYALEYHRDLGCYMRQRTAKYLMTLKDFAVSYGLDDVVYLVNIHGCGGGRAFTYPIGISQLYEGYTQEGAFLSGSDIYLGSMTVGSFQDLYWINTFMEAVNRDDQPLASLEFECGSANYGETGAGRTASSAVDFKIRMCVAQGHKLFNAYLFCGGRNYLLQDCSIDGNNRIAITGERHGFAAPVSPEGSLDYTYERMQKSVKTMMCLADKLAVMKEERDNLAFGFIPDYYMTEFCYPKSKREKDMVQDISRFRSGGRWEMIGRALLLNNYRFSSINVQDKEIPSNQVHTLLVFSAAYMSEAIQKKLAAHVLSGGSLLLAGRVPEYDMEGRECTILADFLKIKSMKMREDGNPVNLSLTMQNMFQEYAEVRTGYAQSYELEEASAVQTLMTVTGTDEITAFLREYPVGKAAVLGTDYICNLEAYRRLLEYLGTTKGLGSTSSYNGLFLSMMKGEKEERLLHILNLDDFDKRSRVIYQGEELFEGQEIEIQSQDGLMLPLNMELDGKFIEYSTAELFERKPEQWTLRLTQLQDVIKLNGTYEVEESGDYYAEYRNDSTYIYSKLDCKRNSFVTVNWKRGE